MAVFTPVATPAVPRDAGNPARALRQSLSWQQILPLPHVTCQLLYTVPGNSRVAPAGIILELDYSHALGIKGYTLGGN